MNAYPMDQSKEHMPRTFHIKPTFESLSDFLSEYFRLHNFNEPIELVVSLPKVTRHIGKPNKKRNVLLTLEFYLDQIQRSHLRGETKIILRRHYVEEW